MMKNELIYGLNKGLNLSSENEYSQAIVIMCDPHSPYNGNCGIPFINFEPVPVPVY